MSARVSGILLLTLFQALWLNVFIPVHTRGQITMPGTKAAAVTHSCCMDDDAGPAKRPDTPSKERAANCSVCAFAAHLMIPPPIDLTPRPTDLLCLAADPAAQSVTTHELILAYLGRAPPQA